jgi:hypothetical protein
MERLHLNSRCFADSHVGVSPGRGRGRRHATFPDSNNLTSSPAPPSIRSDSNEQPLFINAPRESRGHENSQGQVNYRTLFGQGGQGTNSKFDKKSLSGQGGQGTNSKFDKKSLSGKALKTPAPLGLRVGDFSSAADGLKFQNTDWHGCAALTQIGTDGG